MAISDLGNVLKIFGETSLTEEEQKELFNEVLLMTLARASKSDANMHPVEITTIRQIMQRHTGQELTDADVRKAARPELYESVNLRKYLRSVRRQIKPTDRVSIIRALAEVVKSDTEVSVLEIDFFNRVSDALGVTPAELAGLTV